jgi:hypothetical protein
VLEREGVRMTKEEQLERLLTFSRPKLPAKEAT